ncbi:hypothetical protein HYD56_00920 [Mycoplasmopsis bovis]|nr:hypothetical protein [Mycoplasmopsis bovis]QQH66523.1 hypothetical protein HYD56_00920 [Mycoplasmopsis bovis]
MDKAPKNLTINGEFALTNSYSVKFITIGNTYKAIGIFIKNNVPNRLFFIAIEIGEGWSDFWNCTLTALSAKRIAKTKNDIIAILKNSIGNCALANDSPGLMPKSK